MPAIVGTSTAMRPATRGASRAQLQSCRTAESSAADASGRRRQEVRRRAARRRNRTSDDVDVALDFATRCEVLVWVDARRNLLFPRPLLKLLVLLALHDCEGRKRRRGLAHRAHAASAHHQRIGCRCQARNDEEARRRHAPEARTPKFRRGGRSGQRWNVAELHKSLARTLVLMLLWVRPVWIRRPLPAPHAMTMHTCLNPALVRLACPVHVISRPRHDAQPRGLAAAARARDADEQVGGVATRRRRLRVGGRATSGHAAGGDQATRRRVLQQLGLG